MSPDIFWSSYWNKRTSSGHRHKDEFFLEKVAQEKLLYLGKGGRFLDFGCGSGELLKYLVPHFSAVVAVDFSKSMLEAAKLRIDSPKNVMFLHADDTSIWNLVNESFDQISSCQVIQYLNLEQIRSFLKNADRFLLPGGKIVFFDVIDPRLVTLWRAGLFLEGYRNRKVSIGINLIKNLFRKPNDLGYAHCPYDLFNLAKNLGFTGDLAWSAYYEYRYHVILQRKHEC